jgi:hypothetical protein
MAFDIIKPSKGNTQARKEVHKMKKNISEYTEAIKMMINLEGMEAANIANHAALETGLINLEQFQAAARILAAEILNR